VWWKSKEHLLLRGILTKLLRRCRLTANLSKESSSWTLTKQLLSLTYSLTRNDPTMRSALSGKLILRLTRLVNAALTWGSRRIVRLVMAKKGCGLALEVGIHLASNSWWKSLSRDLWVLPMLRLTAHILMSLTAKELSRIKSRVTLHHSLWYHIILSSLEHLQELILLLICVFHLS